MITIKTNTIKNRSLIQWENLSLEDSLKLPLLLKKEIAEGRKKIFINLREIEFLPSIMIGVLVYFRALANQLNARIYLLHTQKSVQDTLKFLGLDTLLLLHATGTIKRP